MLWGCSNTLSIKIAQKPYIIGSLGPKALKYESFDAKGYRVEGIRSSGLGRVVNPAGCTKYLGLGV